MSSRIGALFAFTWWRGLAFAVVCSTIAATGWWIDARGAHIAVTSLEFDPLNIGHGAAASESWRKLVAGEFFATQAVIITSRAVCVRAVEAIPKNIAADGTPDLEQLASRLCSRLEARRLGESLVIELRYRDDDSDRARAFADAVAEAYVQRVLAQRAGIGELGGAHLAAELETAESALFRSESAVADFTQRNRIVALDTEQSLAESALSAYSSALTQARIRRVRASARVAQLEALSKEGVSTVHAADDFLQDMRARVKQLEAEQHRLLVSGGDGHPQLPALRAELANARAQLGDTLTEILEAARSEVAAIDREERDLQRNLEQAQNAALRIATLRVEFNRLRRAERRDDVLREAILGQIAEGGRRPQAKGWFVRILSPASIVRQMPVLPFAVVLCCLCGVACFVAGSRRGATEQ